MDEVIKKWDKEIEKLSPEDQKKYYEAIETLRCWKFFEQEFMPTQIFIVAGLLTDIVEEVKV